MAKSNWETFTAIGCSHGNHIDRNAEKVAKDFVADWKPKHRIHLGDLWDLAALRKGASPEERQEQMSYDYNCGMELLDWYQPQYLTLGNHDFRLWRAAKEYASHTLLADGSIGLACSVAFPSVNHSLASRQRVKCLNWFKDCNTVPPVALLVHDPIAVPVASDTVTAILVLAC